MGLKGKGLGTSNWIETSYWGDHTVCRFVNLSELQLKAASEQDQGYPGKGCSLDYQRVDPGLSYSCSVFLCRYCFFVASCVLMVCSRMHTYCEYMLSLASGWIWTHENHSSLPSTDLGPVAESDKLSSSRVGRKNHWVLSALDLLASGSKDEC